MSFHGQPRHLETSGLGMKTRSNIRMYIISITEDGCDQKSSIKSRLRTSADPGKTTMNLFNFGANRTSHMRNSIQYSQRCNADNSRDPIL